MLAPQTIVKIFTLLHRANPRPTTELRYQSHFELLIAVILSARTTDKIVNRITKQLFMHANSPETIAALGVKKLQKYIRSSGFFQRKARHVLATCNILVTKFGSCVPKTREELESLPGVGRKTANVILNIAFAEPKVAVDTHVLRVSKRLQIAEGKSPKAVEEQLLCIVPQKFMQVAGNLLLLHGRYTCTARKPQCKVCVVHKYCNYKRNFLADYIIP